MNERVSSPRLTVFFDGGCPLCIREIDFYRNRKGADAVDWVDVSAVEDADVAPGLSRCDALARFHVAGPDGARYSGARAFAELWAVLPAFRWAGLVARTPPLVWVLEGAYRLFLPVRPHLQRWVRRATA
ncbi:MAG: DUF393 domain-containing protein [Pseudomonadota bacterium]